MYAAYLLFFHRNLIKIFLSHAFFLTIFIVIILIIFSDILLSGIYAKVISRINTIYLLDDLSIVKRLVGSFLNTIHIINEKPFLGTGLGNSEHFFNNAQNQIYFSNSSFNNLNLSGIYHNIFVAMYISLGLIGFLLFLCLIYISNVYKHYTLFFLLSFFLHSNFLEISFWLLLFLPKFFSPNEN